MKTEEIIKFNKVNNKHLQIFLNKKNFYQSIDEDFNGEEKYKSVKYLACYIVALVHTWILKTDFDLTDIDNRICLNYVVVNDEKQCPGVELTLENELPEYISYNKDVVSCSENTKRENFGRKYLAKKIYEQLKEQIEL